MTKIRGFINEVIAEMKLVTWPTQEELKGSTIVVVAFSIVMALFVWGVDAGLSQLMSFIHG